LAIFTKIELGKIEMGIESFTSENGLFLDYKNTSILKIYEKSKYSYTLKSI